MQLVDEVLEASGGLAQWWQLTRFTIHLSIGGALLQRMPGAVSMKDMVIEGELKRQSLEMTGFTAPDHRALYWPDRIALERADGELFAEHRATVTEFRERLKASTWDELLLAFFCGSLLRAYLEIPFVLAEADVVVSEGNMSSERGERLRALHVRLPQRLAIHTQECTLYFDDQALLRRQQYSSPHDRDMEIVQTYSSYQRYSGIMIPTLSRLLPLQRASATIASVSLVDIEIFDVTFE